MSDVHQDTTTSTPAPTTTTAAAAAATKTPSVVYSPSKLHLLVCTICEHPICDASDILGDKADVNPEYGFAYKFEGMLNICDSSSDDDDDDDDAKAAADVVVEGPAVQKAPYCYRIQHKSYATLQRQTTGSDRDVKYADDNLLISLAEGVISRIQGGQYDEDGAFVSPEELLLPERMSEVCSDQRVDVVRLKERVSDFGVRHEVLATQSEYRLASMELPDSATLNDGSSVSSFIQPLSRSTAAATSGAAPSGATTTPTATSATTDAEKAGIHFAMSYEDVMSGSAEWFPGYVVHNECFCASCGAPVGYRFVPKPDIKWNVTAPNLDATVSKKEEEDMVDNTEDEKEGDGDAKPKSVNKGEGEPPLESFVGLLLSTVKQREWGVRQFARRTVLSRVHTLFDALSLSRQSRSSWATMDCLADFAVTQLEARVNGVGPSRSHFIESVPCALRTIMGMLASTLPVDPTVTNNMDMSHRHAQYLSQAERGRVDASSSRRGGAVATTTTAAAASSQQDTTTTTAVASTTGDASVTATTGSNPTTTAADTAATIRWGQSLRSQLAADSLHHFTRIGREPLLFTSMIADFIEEGGSSADQMAAAAISESQDTLIAGIIRDTEQQSTAIRRLNANRHESTQSDSSPHLLAAAAQLMESTKRHLIDVTVKERIAGYKQQAKLIQQLVDKLKEQNSVLVDLVASQRVKMKANESQSKMYEEIIEAHKTQLGTYDRHIKYQDELAKTLREQLRCSTSEIEEQQKIMKSQNETIKTQNEQMKMLRQICSDVTTERSPIYKRAPVQPACLKGEENFIPESAVFPPKNQAEQERRDELMARSLERQEKLAYLKSLLQQKETLAATLSCNAPPLPQPQSSSSAATASSPQSSPPTAVVVPTSTSTSHSPSAITSPRDDVPEKKEE